MSATLATRISVVIPTCHRNDALADCLARLAPGKQTLTAAGYEVIVTDDGFLSTAETMLRERFPWAHWVAGPRQGPAANRNHGARHASAEWLAFADDDCLPDAGWVGAFADAIQTNLDISVFEGRIYPDRPRRSLAEVSPTNDAGGFLWSCNFAIRRTLFHELGGFDESFRYAAMEDVDLAYRLRQNGHTFRFVKAAAVCHPWRSAGGWKTLKRHQESTFTYLARHPEERGHLNSSFYFRSFCRELLRETLPGILRYRAAGLGSALLAHLSQLQMAWLLAFRSPPK